MESVLQRVKNIIYDDDVIFCTAKIQEDGLWIQLSGTCYTVGAAWFRILANPLRLDHPTNTRGVRPIDLIKVQDALEWHRIVKVDTFWVHMMNEVR